MSYELIGWENKPSTKTPLGSKNLSHMDNGIKDAHDLLDNKANAIILSASGEVITVTDSGEEPLKSMKVFGKSWQNTIGGNQLFDVENPNFLLKVSNILVDGNKVTFTTSDQYGQFGNEYTDLPSGTYTFGYENVNCSDVVEVRAYYGSNGTIDTQIARTTTDNFITFEYDSTKGDLIVWTRPSVGTTITYTGLMLNKGSTALPWEQYTGGIPSPNPNYPQDIHSHGESGSIEYGVYGGNLLDYNTWKTVGIQGGTAEWKDNGLVITPTGTNAYTHHWGNCPIIPVVPGMKVILSAIHSGGKGKFYIFNNSITSNNYNEDIPTNAGKIYMEYIIPEGVNHIMIRVDAMGGAGVTTTYKDVMVTVDSVPSEHSEYIAPQSLTLQTPNGLNGGLVSWDKECNYVDSNGNRYLVDYKDFATLKNVQHFVDYTIDDFGQVKTTQDASWYNAEKSYSYEISGTKGYTTSQLAGKVLGFCTHLTSYAFSDFYGKSIETGCMNNQNYVVVNISKSLGICKTVDEFAQWCRDNNVIFRKALATPIETDLTEEEIAQYKALLMNYPNTTIINDANAYTEVEYVADTKLYIDKKFNELASQLL